MANRFSFELVDDKDRTINMEEAVEGRGAESYEFSFDISIPFDRSTSKITGYRQYKPLQIIKPICKATPIIFQKICEGKKLKSALLTLYRHDPSQGSETAYYQYEFFDVSLVGQTSYVKDTLANNDQHYPPLEAISIVAEKVTQRYLDGNIEYTDEYRKKVVVGIN